jgi:hypothetical protein
VGLLWLGLSVLQAAPASAQAPATDPEQAAPQAADSSEGPVVPPPSEPDAPPPPAEPSYPPAAYYPQPAPAPAPSAYGAYDTGYVTAVPRTGRRDAGPGAREHEGFFLRLTLGFGAGGTRYRENVDGRRLQTVDTRGVSTQLEVSVGGHVGANFCLHGTLLGGGIGEARRNVSGTQDARDKIDTGFGLLGGGATYYFMPINVYVSGVVGIVGITEERDGETSIDTGREGTGFGSMLMLGKEWWVGPRAEWGLGAALRGVLATAPVRIAGDAGRIQGAHVAIAFSATFN